MPSTIFAPTAWTLASYPTPSTASFTSDPILPCGVAATRRRSVDTGGLALSLHCHHSGSGWGGWDEDEQTPIPYAEFLSTMYLQAAVSAPASSKTLTQSSRSSLIEKISQWAFDPHELTEEEVFACVCYLFELLFTIEGMAEDLGLQAESLMPFLLATRSTYNQDNFYHNFRHALDVLQSMYMFLYEGGCVPHISILFNPSSSSAGYWTRSGPSKGYLRGILSNVDVFTLFVAALGHDVGHPGVNNAFMKNACTPVSVIYDHSSALEQMHCSLLLQLMRNTSLGHLISASPPSSNGRAMVNIRDLLVGTILATDMAMHKDWMNRFRNPENASTESNKLLVCQALLKCADISNPTRPHGISEAWSTSLMHEWSKQAALERSLALPISVSSNLPPSRPLSFQHSSLPSKPKGFHISNLSSLSPSDVKAAQCQAEGQLFFINTFASPLFALVSSCIPEMHIFSDRCIDNKVLWEQRLRELKEHVDTSKSSVPHDPPSASSPRFPPSTHSVQNHPTSIPLPHYHSHRPTSLVLHPPVYPTSVPKYHRSTSISTSSTSSTTSSYHSALSAFSDHPFSPMRPRENSWATSTAMSIMTSPGNSLLNIGGDNWQSFSFKRSIMSHRRIFRKDEDSGLESEDGMNDVRRIGKGLEAMRAAYRLSCRRKPGKCVPEFEATVDDARFRRRWSVAWCPTLQDGDEVTDGYLSEVR